MYDIECVVREGQCSGIANFEVDVGDSLSEAVFCAASTASVMFTVAVKCTRDCWNLAQGQPLLTAFTPRYQSTGGSMGRGTEMLRVRQEVVTTLVLLATVFAEFVDKDSEVAVQRLKGEAVAVLKPDKDHFQNSLVDHRD